MKYSIIIAALALSNIPVAALTAARVTQFTGFEDNFNDRAIYDSNWEKFSDEAPGSVEYLTDATGNGFIGITCDSRTAQGIKHPLTNLCPNTLYRVSARVKTDSVAEGRGAVLYVNPRGEMEQPWNASKFMYGTNDWQTVYMDFVSDKDGKTEIVLALGFPWGTYNGGKAMGTAYWDDVKITPTPIQEMKTFNGKHLRVFFDSDKVNITEEELGPWVKQLDKVYKCYSKLVGGVPYGGRKLNILATPGIEPGYWALAGNPILINNHSKIGEIPEKFNAEGDWSFGVTHEIGHVFNAGSMGKSCHWNWNDELFANFRMSYALEKLNGKVSQDKTYQGRDIINYYKKAYDRTIGDGKASSEGDAIHYTLLRIKDKYGWKVFEKAFRKLYSLGDKDIDWRAAGYEKFLFFLRHVSDAAGEDVTKTTYTEKELQLIKEGFELK